MKKKQFLAEVIKVQDLKQFGKKICIVSGVGSGKNYWVENELTKHGNVLLITSRRAKVDETIANSIFEGRYRNSDLEHFTVMTNFGLEKILKSQIINGAMDAFLENFDYIVVDEAHSIVSDSTFTNSAFHLWTFVQYVAEKKTTILMTGTVEPIKIVLETNNWTIIDERDKCPNIVPNIIQVISEEVALNLISRLPQDQKTVYMSNSAKAIMNRTTNSLVKKMSIKPDSIALSMSSSKAEQLVKEKADPKVYDRMEETYKTIIEKNSLPESIKILLTTSRLKEGINIKDESIKIAFCESHYATDIIQFAGRMRMGIDVLYIINDAVQNTQQLHFLEYDYCRKQEIESCNSYLNSLITLDDEFIRIDNMKFSLYATNEDIKNFVNFIENKFQYIRFNHIKNAFEIYELRKLALQQAKKQLTRYSKDRSSYLASLFYDSFILDLVTFYQKSLSSLLQNYVLKEFEFVDRPKDLVISAICRGLSISENSQLSTINEKLKQNKLDYEVSTKKVNSGLNRGKRALIIKKV